jgi:hypothetical protein
MSNKLRNALIAGTAVAAIAGGSLALAQPAPPAPPAADAQRSRLSAEDHAAFTDARIAALKAGLKLTAEQEKNWPAVETAMRDLAKQRADRIAARRDGRNAQAQARPDAMERLRRAADAMTERAAGLKKLADAADPLYKSLDDGQKHRFAVLMRMGMRGPGLDRGPDGPGPRGHHHRRG